MSCTHHNRELRFNVYNNNRSYCEQCLDCGVRVKQENGGYFIKVEDLSPEDLKEATPFIEDFAGRNQLELF